MSQKKYWKSFGELNNTEAFKKTAKDEFSEALPFESADEGSANTPRRDFLKYLGFSTTAAAIAASCEIPVKKAIPLVNRPEEYVPGVAKYYATTWVQDGDAMSIVAKVRDGRPIKVEGNTLSPITGGGTSARVQASVLDLYDTYRLRFPAIDKKEVTFEAIDKEIAKQMAGLAGKPLVILTSSIHSPSSLKVISQFQEKYPGTKHIVYDADSKSGILLANEACFGKRAIPSYRFDNAKVILSLGADFLGTWISPVEYGGQYAKGRKIDPKKPTMSRHIQFESVLSMTGSNADEKYQHAPSETAAVALALLDAISGQPPVGLEKHLADGVQKAASELKAHSGSALVVCGSNDVNIQIVVNAINSALGSYGNTIDWSITNNTRSGIDGEMAALVSDMNAGNIGGIIFIDVNPAYTWFDKKAFSDGLKKIPFSVSFSSKADETQQLCRFSIPNSHYLESWGDAEPASGHYSLIQPTIFPLFKTRQWQDSLLKWSGTATDYLAVLKAHWVGVLGGEMAWDDALQAGVINPGTPITMSAGSYSSAKVDAAKAILASVKKSGKTEIQLYQKISIGVGHGASNPWLQEMPDPVTRATWDNYAIVSPSMARKLLDIDMNDNGQADTYEVNPAKKVIEIKSGNVSMKLPVLIIPGTHENTIGVALGYGRIASIGKTAEGSGVDAFPFTSFSGSSISYQNTADASLVKGETYDVAIVQTHGWYDTPQGNRVEVMKELTLDHFLKAPNEIIDEREKELKPWGGVENFASQGTIYGVYDKPGVHWGMSVDLNTCFGCGACVVACNAENNISVVGKSEVKRYHDMHWLRIDRYFSGNPDNPDVVFQPMMCQHCDNAPCENVCPVAATNHSSEGLNQMTYNRCIGTRYCANNCPYKVRRFNWADYSGADSFPANQQAELAAGHLDPVVGVMNEELTRMVLNPDVTVRSRGVIEKCSFCVQRLQEGKLNAKKESRPLEDSDIKTACQQACPSGSIIFGNVNNSKSEVVQHRAENKQRVFYSLEPVHTLPNVSYLAKVRNKEHHEAAGEQHHS
jgi:molybdopterin-containing oxidoreductase family iron-sulfur binding subunit